MAKGMEASGQVASYNTSFQDVGVMKCIIVSTEARFWETAFFINHLSDKTLEKKRRARGGQCIVLNSRR